MLMSILWGPQTADEITAAKGVVDATFEFMRNSRLANFDWTFIALFAFVVVGFYVPRIRDKKWDSIGAALGLYGIHWLCEITNAIVAHFAGYGMWHVTPESSTFILLIGVSWELSMMFSVAGFTMDMMPEDKNAKMFGINNRVFYCISTALGFSLFEIFLAQTPSFQWVYPFWGAIPVFITVYIPFFVAAVLGHDLQGKKKKIFLGAIWGQVAFFLILGSILGWYI